MKRLLLPLIAALALPTAVSAESEFTTLESPNPHTYKKSTVVRWKEEGKRYISFKGTTRMPMPIGSQSAPKRMFFLWEKNKKVLINKDNRPVLDYTVNCIDNVFDRKHDFMDWINVRADHTAESVAEKYCPLTIWEKLPMDTTRNSWNKLPLSDND